MIAMYLFGITIVAESLQGLPYLDWFQSRLC